MTISADTGFVVRTKVDEQDIAAVRAGQPAIISGEDLGTDTLPGHVVLIGAVAQKSDDPSNTARQIVTTVALDRTVPYLRDGMTVDVDIVTQNRQHVLVVPNDAIRRDDADKPYVLVVVDRSTVTPGVSFGTRIMLWRRCRSASGSLTPITISSLQRGDIAPDVHHFRPLIR